MSLLKELVIQGRILKNIKIFNELLKMKFDYIYNPRSKELHILSGENFCGSDNLKIAELENFIGLYDIGKIKIKNIPDHTEIPVYDIDSGIHIGNYILNKCLHCFKK
jgi:hypothetical protein